MFLDTDSDATPSGYLSDPEGNSIEIGETENMNDASRWVHFHSIPIHSDGSRKGFFLGGGVVDDACDIYSKIQSINHGRTLRDGVTPSLLPETSLVK